MNYIQLYLTIKTYYLNSNEHLLTAFLKTIFLVITSPARLRVKNDMVQSSHVSIKRFYKGDRHRERIHREHPHAQKRTQNYVG